MPVINERVQKVFQKVFDDSTIQISREITANDIEAWDSLAHVQLIIALEAEFKIRFKSSEILSFKSVGDILDLIQSKVT